MAKLNDSSDVAVVSALANVKINDAEEIRMDQNPTKLIWALTPLYKTSVSGGWLFWQVGFDGVDHMTMSHGHVNGIINTNKTEVKLNSTGRNMQEQALLEARQKYKLKYREGYQPSGETTAPLIKAMKGNEYTPKSITNWPVYTQPKFDGIRMLCQDVGNGQLAMRSWLNNPFTHLKHLEPELREFMEYLPKFATLDGELYNHDYTFNMITSAVKTVKRVHPNLQYIQYWIFDVDYTDPQGAPYEKRFELLVNAYKRYLSDNNNVFPKTFVIVQCSSASSHEEIVKQHDQYVAQNYEGIMIKKISNNKPPTSKDFLQSLYKSGKSNHILKYKYFKDEEAIIVGVVEGEGTEKGLAIFTVKDPRGNQFNVRMKGSFERRRMWFQNPQLIIGKYITIKYQELSEYGVPRFPVGKAIRDYE